MTTLLLKNARSKIELNQSSLNIVQYCTTYLNLFSAVASGSSFTQKYYSFRRYVELCLLHARRPRIIIIIYYYNYSDQAVHVLVS